MASRVLGVDLGAYSVKVVVTSPGFRQAQVSEVIERMVPPGDEPHLVRAAAVAGEILSRYREEEDSIYSSIAGDKVFLHVLEFGFKSLRRADLDSAVGAELEGVLPIDLEDMVYAYEQIPKLTEPLKDLEMVSEDEPTFVSGIQTQPLVHGRVAEPPAGMRILAAATQRSRAEEFLVALRGHGVDPRGLLAAPAPYARLVEKIDSGAVAILDIGHMRTEFCLSKDGKPIFARSLARGGHHLTRALAKAWNLDYQSAEDAKHSNGFVASSAMPATSENTMRISELISKDLSSMIRDLRRTLKSCRAKTGFVPERLILVGGGSRLQGLAPFFAEQLQTPVSLLSQDTSMHLLGPAASMASLDTCALALGIALDGASAKPSFDLRQGALAFKADVSFLRTKLRALGGAALAIMAFGVLSAYTGVSKLRSAEEILDKRVALESAEAFGEQLNASEVLARVGPVEGGRIVSPVPSMTAYDMLLAFNEALPPRDKAVLDVQDIDIKPGKVVVKATSSPFDETSALQGIKNLEETLKASKCFKDFSSPESQPGANDSRQFTLTIKSSCNQQGKE
jgi:Tfp pilus assembly PilM family ATPase